jgi:hypothetical protein
VSHATALVAHRQTPYESSPADAGASAHVHTHGGDARAGSGRAGKPGRLLGSSNSVYEGDVLAGRPHGWGRYYALVSCRAASSCAASAQLRWDGREWLGAQDAATPMGTAYHDGAAK